ncbi:hypothetical protein KKB18_10345, partial [bacterium]|nr:hypothetical protein [bacterium]
IFTKHINSYLCLSLAKSVILTLRGYSIRIDAFSQVILEDILDISLQIDLFKKSLFQNHRKIPIC